LEKGWLTIALALMAPGIAWIAEKRPWPALPRLPPPRRTPRSPRTPSRPPPAVALPMIRRIVWDPRIVGAAIGVRPVFNWLLYGYGVPAVSFFVAGHMLRREADDVP